MKNEKNKLQNAQIRSDIFKMSCYDGQERPVSMYRVIAGEEIFFFECPFDWVTKFDYYVTIFNFGLRRLSFAGSTAKALRHHFTKEEATSAKLLIEKYFSGGADVTDFPLNDPRTRCLGVRYSADWVIEQDFSGRSS